MKKKITSATIVLAALLAIVCFAVRYEQSQKSTYEQNRKSEYEEWLDAYAKAVWETSVSDQTSEEVEAIRTQFLEEVAANISLAEPMGLTYEEFLAKMERLDETYNNSNYFSTNAEVMFEAAIEGGYRETLIPSIICLETAGATRMRGENNSWNAIERNFNMVSYEEVEVVPGTNNKFKFTDFDSSEESIETLSHDLKETLLTGATLKDFAETWDTGVDPEVYAIHLHQQLQRMEGL